MDFQGELGVASQHLKSTESEKHPKIHSVKVSNYSPAIQTHIADYTEYTLLTIIMCFQVQSPFTHVLMC